MSAALLFVYQQPTRSIIKDFKVIKGLNENRIIPITLITLIGVIRVIGPIGGIGGSPSAEGQ